MAAVILNWQYVLSLYILWSQGTDTSKFTPYLVVLAFVVQPPISYVDLSSFLRSPPSAYCLIVVVVALWTIQDDLPLNLCIFCWAYSPPFLLLALLHFTVLLHSCLPTGGKAYGHLKSEQDRQLDEINQVWKLSVWHRVCLEFVTNSFLVGTHPSYLRTLLWGWTVHYSYMYVYTAVVTCPYNSTWIPSVYSDRWVDDILTYVVK